MNVLFVAAEMAPYIKTGGLADVAGALPAALRALGHDVRVVMPRYQAMRERGIPVTGPIAASFLPAGERQEELRVWQLADERQEVPTYLLDIPAAFERASTYGDRDDDRRFLLFARGTLALVQHLREVEGWQPDVLHLNDWHAALVSNFLKTYYAYTFGHIATVFTIHNLAYQGQFSPATLSMAGLAEGGLVENALGPRYANSFCFMARGLLFSDVITTVSPTYAQEIMTAEYGERLDGVLRARRDRVAGVLNGIDTRVNDPATDPHLPVAYSVEDMSGKAMCKAALQQELGLPESPTAPVLGIVSRLVEQKGLDLVLQVLPSLMANSNAQFVLLGSGDARLEAAFSAAARQHPTRIAARLGFDAALAQRIYAGSDMFLMPSRFEPCGLGQMIALRYGSVPVVRATGGLADTVREGYDGNGFRFHPYEARHFGDAITRALRVYAEPESWALLRERGMREDNSWALAARHYEGAYQWARQTIR
jgi:starch synthase